MVVLNLGLPKLLTIISMYLGVYKGFAKLG